jgi:hypothetical protein
MKRSINGIPPLFVIDGHLYIVQSVHTCIWSTCLFTNRRFSLYRQVDAVTLLSVILFFVGNETRMSDQKEYDIQGQVVNKNDHPVSLPFSSASAEPFSTDSRYSAAGEGHNLIPATAPGLDTGIKRTTVIESSAKDPWNLSEEANKAAVKDMLGDEAADEVQVIGSTGKYSPANL